MRRFFFFLVTVVVTIIIDSIDDDSNRTQLFDRQDRLRHGIISSAQMLLA